MPKPVRQFKPEPKEPEETPRQIGELINKPADRLAAMRLVQTYTENYGKLKEMEKKQEELKNKIKDYLGQYNIEKCLVGTVRVNYFGYTRKSLDKAMLLEAGVTVSQLTKGTKESTVYTLRIEDTSKKVEGEGQE